MENIPTKKRKTEHQVIENEDIRGAASSSHKNGSDNGQARRRLPRDLARVRGGLSFDPSEMFANGSYKSTLFRLQIDELLSNVQFKRGRREENIDAVLCSLKKTIEAIPDRGEMTIPEAEKLLRRSSGVAIPFSEPRPPKDAKYKLAYEKPSSVNVIGSYASTTCVKSGNPIPIDVSVSMPSSIFQEKDYLNHRYFHKRAYYLACLAAGIKDAPDCPFKVTFEYFNGNDLHPVLKLEMAEDHVPRDVRGKKTSAANGSSKHESAASAPNCIIRVLPVLSHDQFPSAKLLPNRNCVRPHQQSTDKVDIHHKPTPFYNSSICFDALVTPYLKLFHKASTSCGAFKDACILGRVWLQQRGFSGAIDEGGFGHFEWATLMALLLEGNGPKHHRLLPDYSSYQLFKATLQFLATRDLVTHPIFLGSDDLDALENDGPMLFDGERKHNLFYKMTPWAYRLLRHYVVASLRMLNDSLFDHFDQLFIMKANRPLETFDLIARLPILSLPPNTLDHESKSARFCRRAYTALHKGLGDRARVVYLASKSPSAWAVDRPSQPRSSQGDVEIRIIVDPANAGRAVDHGPSAELKKEAAAFRSFWGEKAELRRFKDGSILETLVWPSDASDLAITQQIMTFVLTRHVHAEAKQSIKFVADPFGKILPGGTMGGPASLRPFKPLTTAYDELVKAIRGLEGLPLQLRQVSGAGPVLRYSSVYPPSSAKDNPSADPVDVVVNFEGSGRWPDDLVAIQRTKIALLLKMGELLEASVPGVITRVGLENQKHPTLNAAFLDVIYGGKGGAAAGAAAAVGAAFRLRIQNEREQTLNERSVQNKTLSAQQREEAAAALAAYKRAFVHAPAHTQRIGLLCSRFPLLSQTIRLAKKWFSAHLLLALHFADEFVELVVAHAFTQPGPWPAPSSVASGFLRTLLFLSRWDWRSEPLLVDLRAGDNDGDDDDNVNGGGSSGGGVVGGGGGGGGGFAAGDVEAMATRFEAWRKIDPALNRVVLFVASSRDADGVTWTQAGPSKVVAARMTTLARAACALVHDSGVGLNARALFKSPLTDYDFLLHLHPRFTRKEGDGPAANEQVAAGASTAIATAAAAGVAGVDESVGLSEEEVQLVGYRPVLSFIEELKSLYSSNILFFYDIDGGPVIAGLWNPRAVAPRPWKVNLSYSTQPVVAAAGGHPASAKGNVGDGSGGGGGGGGGGGNDGDDGDDGDEVHLELNRSAILNEIARLGGDLLTSVEVLRAP